MMRRAPMRLIAAMLGALAGVGLGREEIGDTERRAPNPRTHHRRPRYRYPESTRAVWNTGNAIPRGVNTSQEEARRVRQAEALVLKRARKLAARTGTLSVMVPGVIGLMVVSARFTT